MCGIVGFSSRTRGAAVPLINGLRRLEYRGYDSAGVALESEEGLLVYKCKGKVSELARVLAQKLDEKEEKECTLGIAHTRWATHGLPTEVNAHPQLADGGNLALVHNGIIENYAALRAQLEQRGCKFVSQTDTEVLAHLIATFDQGDFLSAVTQALTEVLAHLIATFDQGDFLSAVTQALKQVRGTYGIAVLSRRHPGEMIVARCGSPLVVGIGEDATIVASDVSAIVEHTRQVIYLNDGDVARVTPEGVNVYTLDNAPVTREVKAIEWNLDAVEKGGYAHFMLKEIFEQPETLRNTIRGRLDFANGTSILSGLSLTPRELAGIRRAVIVACGTSLHAGMAAKYLIESLADIPASPEQAAEFRYCNPIVGPDDLVLAVSQSGETADTLAAVRESIRKGALVAGLCNVVGSTIAREVGRGVYLHAGPEISVASTKAFTAQVTTLLMIALKLGRTRRYSREEGIHLCEEIAALPDKVAEVLEQNDAIAKIAEKYFKAFTAQVTTLLMIALKLGRTRRYSREEGIHLCEEIAALPDKVKEVLEQNDAIAKIAEKYFNVSDMFFIGRGILYPTALEGALKMKEISYLHAEGYQSAELKHGPIALLDEKTPVVALLNDIPGKEKTIGNVQECRARKAPVLGIITKGDKAAAEHCNDIIELPATTEHTAPIVTAVALQLFAYHVARLRGCEIDQPRNLAKSVTVE